MNVRYLTEHEVRSLITPADALAQARRAFTSFSRGEVVLPDVMFLDLKEQSGEVHGKGAYIIGSPYYVIKVASGFYRNPDRGLPVTFGVVWAFDATTGLLDTILFDNGFLTELRTGASGALASDLLAPDDVEVVGILGCGSQARFQLEALLGVRSPRRVMTYCRTRASAESYAAEVTARFGLAVTIADSAEALVRECRLIITTTSARQPVIRSEWVQPGTHITAMGSDVPDKQELEPGLLGRATVVVDSARQCATQGELHHALEAGVMAPSDVHGELGEIAAGGKPGRTSEHEITIADLTGVGVLDAAVAAFVVSRAHETGQGERIQL